MMTKLTRPLLFLVLFNLLPQLTLRPLWVNLFCLVLVGYRLYLEFKGSKMPPRWIIWLGQITICLAIWAHYHSILGDEAGGAFLTLLLCIKIYELNRRRDYFLTCILCVLVLMSYLLLDQGLMITGFLVADVILILAVFLALEDESWSWTSWRMSLKPSMALAFKAFPLLVFMFLLFPRFSTGFGTGGGSGAKMGVSDTLRPGAVSHLMSSDELIFRATFLNGDIPPQAQLYWRGAVLNNSIGLNWDRTRDQVSISPPGLSERRPDIEIYLEPGSEKFLFALDSTRTIAFPNDPADSRIRVRDGKTYELKESSQVRERYVLQDRQDKEPVAMESDAPEDFLSVHEKPSTELRRWLQSYEGLSAGKTVGRLLDKFHNGGYQYSLKPPPVANLDEFLFKTKVGFCEHYAGSFATLLRYLKIPSRVVMGFQGGTPSILKNFISVRGHDAHAWVEYYDPDAKRWRRVDPTVQVAPLRLSEGSESYFANDRGRVPSWLGDWSRALMRSRAFVDEVEASWTGFLLHFDLARQREILAKLGMEEVLFRALPVFLVLTVALILAFVYFFESRRRAPLSNDERLYQQLLALLVKWRIEKAPNEGPLTLMAKIEAASPQLALQVAPILEPLVAARFGRTPLTAQSVLLLQQRLHQLKRFLRLRSSR